MAGNKKKKSLEKNTQTDRKQTKDAGTKSNRRTLVYVAVGALVVLLILLFFLGRRGGEEVQKTQRIDSELITQEEFDAFVQSVSREYRFKTIKQPDRAKYGIYPQVFEELPPIPKDFGEIDFMLEQGGFFAIGRLDESYYKQPEFYPLFEENALKLWKEPDPTRWTVYGYGSYPADQWSDGKPGDSLRAVFFFYTSWGVQTWQGIRLAHSFPLNTRNQRSGKDVKQDPNIVSKYFNVSITPNEFLLAPTYPKFSNTWAQKIAVEIQVAPNTPKGEYLIAVDVVEPSKENIEKWSWGHKNLYFSAASSTVRPGREEVRLFINIE